jgi:hypothetical protein
MAEGTEIVNTEPAVASESFWRFFWHGLAGSLFAPPGIESGFRARAQSGVL